MDLGDLVGQRIWLKLLMMSDAFAEEDGIYIRDMEVIALETVTGKTASMAQHAVVLFPNIANDQVTIKSDIPLAEIYAVNTLGHALPIDFDKAQSVLHIKNWPAGVYFLKIKLQNGSTVTKKLLVEKH